MREMIRPKKPSDLTPAQRTTKIARDKEYENEVKKIYKDLPSPGDPKREAELAKCRAKKYTEYEKYKTDALASGWWEEKTTAELINEIDAEIQSHQEAITFLEQEKAALQGE